MFRRHRWLLLVLTLAVAAAVVTVVVRRGHRPEAPVGEPVAEGIHTASGVPVDSPELRINVATVKWTNHPDYTDWACLVECREPDGCHAEVQLVVDYISSGTRQRLTLGGRLDVASGETVRIGRAQRPSVTVDRVEQVTLQVLDAFHRDAPTPTPMV